MAADPLDIPYAQQTEAFVPASGVTAQRICRWWFGMLGFVLFGYAVFNKGFAYIGLPPLFIGEAVLGAGLFMTLFATRLRTALGQTGCLLLLPILAWCAVRTLPYFGEYRFDAARDAVLIGYSLYTICVVTAILERPALLRDALIAAQRALPWAILLIPFAVLATYKLRGVLPNWPWGDVRIIFVKQGDTMVFLAAITVFMMVGFAKQRSALWALPIIATAGAMGLINRGGMLAYLAAVGLAAVLYPRSAWLWKGAVAAFVVMTVIVIMDPRIQVPGREREISVQQAVNNVTSIIGNNTAGDLDNTKSWRIDWWTKIVGYTFHGEYFWQGKGFGINLANSDGFQVFQDESLRSPHNAHMTVLARSGVIGLALWAVVHLYWLGLMARLYLRARRRDQQPWAGLAVLLICIWLALSIHASFDVFFEGPMGGIWLWSVIGFGIAANWVYRRHPDILAEFPNAERVG